MKKRIFYMLALFLLLLPQSLAAYLDPGTGSMLFSALVGLVSTLYFTARSSVFTLRVKLTGYLLGKQVDERRHSLLFFSEGRQYWNCFAPILKELERREVVATYWTMDPEDPALSTSFSFITSRFIGKGYRAFAQMNALQADVCVMTTPSLDVLQIRRSRKVKHYSHIIHALDDCTTYRVFGTDYFDSVLLSGQHQVEALECLEAKRNIAVKQKYIVGCTYLDVLQEKLDAARNLPLEPKAGFCILIAPSWGPNGLLAKYGMALLQPLLSAGYRLIVRPHPQSNHSEAKMLEELREQTVGQAVRWDFERENIRAFLASDLMISDFSSVVYDYSILLQRPVFISEFDFNYDGYDAMDLLPREPWVICAGREVGIPFCLDDITRLPELLCEYQEGNFQRKLAELRASAYRYPGQAGVRAADVILELRDQS